MTAQSASPPQRQKRSSTSERGYGSEHQKLRRRWEPSVDRGRVACFRCGELIAAKGFPCVRCLRKGKSFAAAVRCRFDLGHNDVNRSQWTGPEHTCCNRATSAHKAGRRHFGLPSWWSG